MAMIQQVKAKTTTGRDLPRYHLTFTREEMLDIKNNASRVNTIGGVSVYQSVSASKTRDDAETTNTGLALLAKFFSRILPLGKLGTKNAVSCVFPPTRMFTPPPWTWRFAIRLRNGTWTSDLQRTVIKLKAVFELPVLTSFFPLNVNSQREVRSSQTLKRPHITRTDFSNH